MEELYKQLSEATVPTSTIICMTTTVLLTVAVPVLLAVYLRKKYNCNLKALLVGALTWIVFARIVEGIMHQIVLGSSVGATIQGNTLYFSLYAAAMAAVFEEVGRLMVMKTALRTCFDNDKNALMYGVGHGGIECIVILGLPMISGIVYAQQINARSLATLYELLKAMPEERAIESLQSLMPLVSDPSVSFLLGMIERIPAIAIHMALSVLVWKAIKDDTYAFLWLALFLHFLTDFLSVYIYRVTESVLIAEVVIYVTAIVVCCITYFLAKKPKTDNSMQ